MASPSTHNVWELHPLPQEVIDQIGKMLNRQALQAIRQTCQSMSHVFAPVALESLYIFSYQVQVAESLQFAIERNLMVHTKSLLLYSYPLPGVIENSHTDNSLVQNIFCAVHTANRLQFLDLNLGSLTTAQFKILKDKLSVPLMWSTTKGLRIQLQGDFSRFSIICKKTFPELEALHWDACSRSYKGNLLRMAAENFPNLKRLHFTLQPRDFAVEHCTPMVAHIALALVTDFPNLSWLTIDAPDMLDESIRSYDTASKQNEVTRYAAQAKEFVEIICKLKDLKRLALTITTRTVSNRFYGKELCGEGRRAFRDGFYTRTLNTLLESLEHVQEICIISRYPKYYHGTRSDTNKLIITKRNLDQRRFAWQWPDGVRDD